MDDTDTTDCYHSDASMMAELAKVRAELTLLEGQERQLLKRLCSVRSAARAQGNRIDELLKHTINPPISRLPNTALYQLISLTVIGCGPFAKRKLASVSGRWRDVVLASPGLWTTIGIRPGWPAFLVITHLKRSRECPLDIQIYGWCSKDEVPKVSELLGLVISYGYRWRSLIVRRNSKHLEHVILKSIWNMMLPPLKHVSIYGTEMSDYPRFLDSQHAPTLEHLHLRETVGLHNFSAAASLKSLSLRCSPSGALLPSIMSLRMLTMSGSSCGALLPNTIHMPLLESLTVMLDDPQSLLAAISQMFADLENKFLNVPRTLLLAAFPGARHIEMNVFDFVVFCFPKEEDSPLCPTDRWSHLEHLSLEQVYYNIPNVFVKWLRARKLEGRPALQATLSKFDNEGVLDGPELISLYKSLHEYCVLELEDVLLTINLTLCPSDSDVYGNSPIMDMVEREILIGTALACTRTGTDTD
ncbi:hypothetical protein F5J12DRAFT_915049 [Pisolithus orientalis]|uniref:uncharacterized protein n=1 Tax=Pisolithus orientalis TaxID=936130 RepID=UPI002224AEB3|nr:uncharacterized protein F5J12DRAFT_915049 [Pisolithus orientalis]KAI5995751.1 hypothetical protein F5J12DRAFT_915049 [Pisolithus orientalis]